MDKRGLAQPDSNVYGFYAVRLKESLRRGTPATDSLMVDSLIEFEEDQSEVADILDQIFGKRRQDTVATKKNEQSTDPAVKPKTPAEIRREKREQRRLERERKKNDGL